MDQAQRLQMAARIAQLRERSPLTQPEIADQLHIGLRAYQKLERQGTTRYERCEELAAIHAKWTKGNPDWEFVSPDWIWDGRQRETTAPDLIANLGTDGAKLLGEINQKLDDLIDRIRALEALQSTEAAANADSRSQIAALEKSLAPGASAKS